MALGHPTSLPAASSATKYNMTYVFAIKFNSDMRMGSTEHPFFKALHTMAGKSGKIDDLQLPTFHAQKTGLLVDTTLVPEGQQESTDLRAFDSFSTLDNDLKMIENLQIHVLHAGSLVIVPWTYPDTLSEYIVNCKEQLNVVLEALMFLKNMKGPLGLTKLTVVDKVPYKRPGACATGLVRAKQSMKAMFANAYWPLLTQAAATLGISLENFDVNFYAFPETDCPMRPLELAGRRNKALPKLPSEKMLKRKHEERPSHSQRGRRYPIARARDSCESPTY